jgi:GT2 family glycosyltransferase
MAAGEMLIFSDDDRVVSPGFVEAHIGELERGQDQVVMGWQHGLISLWRPDLPLDTLLLWRFLARGTLPEAARRGEVMTLVRPDDVRDRLEETVQRFGLDERWWIEGCIPIITRYGEQLSDFAVPWILGTTGNMSVSRRAVVEVGSFDESFGGWGLEDLDLCYRLHHAGLRSRAVRQALSYHQAHPTGNNKRRSWLGNLVHFIRKFESLDAALYGYYFTRAHVVDMHEFNQLYLSLARDEVAPSQRKALIRAYREIAEMRIRTLLSSGGGNLLGLVQDEW